MAGKSSKDAYGAESTFTGLNIDPEALTIVGLDCAESECPELADPSRIDAPGDTLVASIAEYGIKEPVLIRKLPSGAVAVVDGRQRVMAARKVKAKQKKAGADVTILVPCKVDTAGNAADAAATMIVTNEHRRDDSTLTKARKAAAISAMGHADAKVQTMFGVSRVTLANWRTLLQCTPEILAKIEADEIPATLGFELGKLPAADQAKRLAEILAANAKGGAAVEHVRKTRNGAAADAEEDGDEDSDGEPSEAAPAVIRSTWTKKHVAKLQSFLDPASYVDGDAPDEHKLAHALLTILLGDDPTMKGLKPWPELRQDCKGIGPEADARAAAKRAAAK